MAIYICIYFVLFCLHFIRPESFLSNLFVVTKMNFICQWMNRQRIRLTINRKDYFFDAIKYPVFLRNRRQRRQRKNRRDTRFCRCGSVWVRLRDFSKRLKHKHGSGGFFKHIFTWTPRINIYTQIHTHSNNHIHKRTQKYKHERT